MMAHVERHLALWYTRAKEMTRRLFIESVRDLQESAWAVQYHTLHHYAHRWVLYQRPRETLQAKRNLAYSAWMGARLQSWILVHRVEHAARLCLVTRHVGELEQIEHGRLTTRDEAKTHGLSRWTSQHLPRNDRVLQ